MRHFDKFYMYLMAKYNVAVYRITTILKLFESLFYQLQLYLYFLLIHSQPAILYIFDEICVRTYYLKFYPAAISLHLLLCELFSLLNIYSKLLHIPHQTRTNVVFAEYIKNQRMFKSTLK